MEGVVLLRMGYPVWDGVFVQVGGTIGIKYLTEDISFTHTKEQEIC